MRSPLEAVPEEAITGVVASGWGLRFDEFRYLPEGGGAYHWVGRADGVRWFVTCDDLDTKPWWGSERDAVFANLLVAYGAAIDLRASGAEFVVAAVPAASGAAALRLDDRHSVSVFPYVDGTPGRWGEALPPVVCEQLVTLLARLHRHTSTVPSVITRDIEADGRAALEVALGDLGTAWDSGPFAEEARLALASHAAAVVALLEELDGLAARLHDPAPRVVLTHGEPHPGNLIRTETSITAGSSARSAVALALLDWDTVALARPERDLWMLADVDVDLLDRYRDLTGITPDREALRAFRLVWAVSDLAAFTAQLRAEHGDDVDTHRALLALTSILTEREPRPYGKPASM